MRRVFKDTSRGTRARWGRWVVATVGVLVALISGAAGAGVWYLRGSLAALEGSRPLPGLSAPVRVERDALGVPTLRGENPADVARALGFLHAQERFFQMDLLRRRAAGELAELFGDSAVAWDTAIRVHRFRARAARTEALANKSQVALLTAYCDGVNAGLAALRRPPFEYLLLGVSPQPWRVEDSILVVYSMFIELHDETGAHESSLGVLHDTLPAALAQFLDARGGAWDAPITGDAFAVSSTPGPDVVDLRRRPRAAAPAPTQVWDEPLAVGSNNWAVAGALTAHGGALLANDMHLGLAVPNTWYRASLGWPAGNRQVRVTGVTLPGTPLLVAGSSGRVAWGFTNAYGDFSDLVVLEERNQPTGSYRTPAGWKDTEKFRETIRVKGSADRTVEVEETVWGPIIDRDHRGRRRAFRWSAHDPEAVNLAILDLLDADSIDEAMDVAHRTGIPPQNFLVADHYGRIGWTIMGRIPRRVGCDGRLPTSWADGGCRWDGFLAQEAVPRVADPPSGRLWTANARVVDGPMLALLGDGGYVLGARARQIRDDLAALARASEADMLAVQLDDRALFLAPWRKRLLAVLTPAALAAHPRLVRLLPLVERWSGRASVGDAGYRYVRAFREKTVEVVLAPLLAPCREADKRFRASALTQAEGVVTRLLDERPLHLLDPRFASWDDLLLTSAEEAVTAVAGDDENLAAHTWGRRNTAAIAHPLTRAVPALAPLLNMPRDPLPGDWHMPRVQGPAFGASERFAVSPGREEQGYFHMPAGQSGHPLSPFYRAGHTAWVKGEATPFLPGPTVHTLLLHPAP